MRFWHSCSYGFFLCFFSYGGPHYSWLVVSIIFLFKVLGSDHLTVGEPYSYGESECFRVPDFAMMTLGEAGHSIQWGPGLQPEVGHHYDIVFDLTSASEYTGSVALLFPSLKPVRIVGLCDAGVIGCNFSALKARFDGVIGGLCQYSVDVNEVDET